MQVDEVTVPAVVEWLRVRRRPQLSMMAQQQHPDEDGEAGIDNAAAVQDEQFWLAKQVVRQAGCSSTTLYGVGDTVTFEHSSGPQDPFAPAPGGSQVRVGQIVALHEDAAGVKTMTVRLYCRPVQCTLERKKLLQQFQAQVRQKAKASAWDNATRKAAVAAGIHEQELFFTESTTLVPLESIRAHAHLFKDTPPQHRPLRETEYVVRFMWDAAGKALTSLSSEQITEARIGATACIGDLYQAEIPEWNPRPQDSLTEDTEVAAEAVCVWGGLKDADQEQVQHFLAAARDAETLREGMVVRFTGCRDTWGVVVAPPTSATGHNGGEVAMARVHVEGRDLLVPLVNIIGHFSGDVALRVLEEEHGNVERALECLSNPGFAYDPSMHWPLKAVAKLPALRKAAMAKAHKLDSPDGPYDASMDLSVVRKRSAKSLGVSCSPNAAVELVLRCPPPPTPPDASTKDCNDAEGKDQVVDSATESAQLRLLRAINVCLLPAQAGQFSQTMVAILGGKYSGEAAKTAAICQSLSERPDLVALLQAELQVIAHVGEGAGASL
eukprot:TRINITY_DN5547_c0_g1_i3.p1 TRINITY_DN5547_c0_g1~~TRINITY_DN5547_c0_g1_i3.p1  ORF type:complete len:552 (-),score=122.08 TRINITY_DN5547_c0_g1_i3:325-1980(-)